jgi:hypothetical protein
LRPVAWRNQRHEILPRHYVFHFVEERSLARAPVTQVKGQAGLFHAPILPGNVPFEHQNSTVLNTIPKP